MEIKRLIANLEYLAKKYGDDIECVDYDGNPINETDKVEDGGEGVIMVR